MTYAPLRRHQAESVRPTSRVVEAGRLTAYRPKTSSHHVDRAFKLLAAEIP